MSNSASNGIPTKKRAPARQHRISSRRGASCPRSLARSATPESWEVRILAGLPPARRDHGLRPAEVGLRAQAMHPGIEVDPASDLQTTPVNDRPHDAQPQRPAFFAQSPSIT